MIYPTVSLDPLYIQQPLFLHFIDRNPKKPIVPATLPKDKEEEKAV
jgi:hypothetical protein